MAKRLNTTLGAYVSWSPTRSSAPAAWDSWTVVVASHEIVKSASTSLSALDVSTVRIRSCDIPGAIGVSLYTTDAMPVGKDAVLASARI